MLLALRTLLLALLLLLVTLQKASQVLGQASQASGFAARVAITIGGELTIVVLITIRVLKRREQMAAFLVSQDNNFLTDPVEDFQVLSVLKANIRTESHTVAAITKILNMETLLSTQVIVESIDMLVTAFLSQGDQLQIARRAAFTRILVSLIQNINTQRLETAGIAQFLLLTLS